MDSLTAGLVTLAAAVVLDAGLILAWRWMRTRRAARKLHAAPAAIVAGQLAPAKPIRPDPSPAAGAAASAALGEPLPAVAPPALAWLRPEAVMLSAGVLLTVFGQTLLRRMVPSLAWAPLVVIGAGLVLFLGGGYLAERGTQRALHVPGWAAVTGWLRVTPAQMVCLGLAPVFGLVAALAAGDGALMTQAAVAMIAWGLGVLLVVVGSWPHEVPRWKPSWKILGLALALGAAALLIRAVATSHIPIILTGDEGSAGMSAVEFVHGVQDNPFIMGWYSFPSFYFLLQSFWVRLLGNTIEAIRLPSAFAGALTVAALYLVARPMFGNRAAIMAALFLGGLHFHNHFSRIALNNVWDGLWFVVVLGAYSHGWRTGRRASFILGGLVLGLAQYFYASSRMLLALVPLWLLIATLLDRSRLRPQIAHLALSVLAAAAAVFPLGVFYLRFPDQFIAPISRFSILGEWMQKEVVIAGQSVGQILLRQLSLGFQAYTATPLRHWYTPEVPILRDLPAALFLLGVTLMLLRLRDERVWFLGLWLLAFGVAGGLSESTPAAQRYVAAAPAACLALAYGLDRLAGWVARLWPRARPYAGLAVIGLVAVLALDDLRFYYLEYTPTSDFGGDNGMVAQRLADHLRYEPASAHVAMFGSPRMGYYSIPSLQYLVPQIDGSDMNQPWGSPENPPLAGHPLIFVFLPDHEADLSAVRTEYPGGQLVEEPSRAGGTLFWMYRVP
jgi:hypothetical protein